MRRISTLTLVLISIVISTSANCQVTYVNNGTSASYTLYAGDSLNIAHGTFTGTINNWQEGARISVANGATFKPANFGYFLGRIYNYGTTAVSSINGQTSSFRLYNYGIFTVTGDTYLGGSASLQNNYGATITFNGGMNSNSSSILNNGSIVAKGDWYSGNGSTITNTNLLTVEGNLQVNGSTVTNTGMLYTKKELTLSGATFNNNCRTIADASIAVSTSTVNNDGLFWASNANHNSTITNGGTIVSTINGKIKSVNFINNGNISGKGFLYFTGVTTNNGTIGKSGSTSDTLKVYDVSRTNPSKVFDHQNGTVYTNTKYAVFTAPDTVYAYPSCALQYTSMMTALPVKWNNFFVNLSNNIPAVSWSSDQEEGTFFEVQRSYNGVDFISVTTIAAQAANNNYYYQDREVNQQSIIIYYRVKAVELSGAQKFTEIRTVRFSSQPGISIQTAPNPFTSQFNINYQAGTAGTLTIRLFSINGQLQFMKTVSVIKGFNVIAVTEAARLAQGFYSLQLSMNNAFVATEKIVKQ